ncbi:hypothetical protein ILUMI_03774 [Ignelater luminosus]|uniref:Uncharacterized protein n=1 Tax=Ignelater luminosus TaxID=2038154 RepID=A0A8K0GF72_IGNLU|nr:hypothetical protein ILUMI_03774 [Ignelater luminosus]
MDIDILGILLTAEGITEISTGLTNTHFTLYAEPTEVDGVTYLKLRDAKIKIDVKDAKSRFDGSVNGDKNLSYDMVEGGRPVIVTKICITLLCDLNPELVISKF